MVIDVRTSVSRDRRVERRWTDDAAYRLAAAVAADPSVDLIPERRPESGLGALATRLEPIIGWARTVPEQADDTAIRHGVHVAATRALFGLPRRTILVAFHEIAATLASETPAPSRLEDIAIEVGLRLRRLPAHWDDVAAS